MKQLPTTIKSCRVCPYRYKRDAGYNSYYEVKGNKVCSIDVCGLSEETETLTKYTLMPIVELDTIPKWCPLEEKK